ncbi:hypothetical protein C1H46_030903 [Malus baccata]|uniref:Uncharacterized protein n=1 Tax=Malus baccata TaxID=106549 RepID=A0A540LB79_MALBA|nr:hypothetical protein C1H46_030903 [Malus baccata]
MELASQREEVAREQEEVAHEREKVHLREEAWEEAVHHQDEELRRYIASIAHAMIALALTSPIL